MSLKIRFTKMHGLGNDYIYVNCLGKEIKNPAAVSIYLSHRHFGVGSDGLALILPSGIADFRMRMFNADGSEAEMCGNAIRCVGKYVYDNKLTQSKTITVETLAGIKTLNLTIQNDKVSLVKVDMGVPELTPALIPMDSKLSDFIAKPVVVDGRTFKVTAVSMGNPHAVSFVEHVDQFQLERFGPKMEIHPLFPKKVNVEYAEIIDRHTIKMRVWERGSGETMACGTGACAVLVAAVLNKLTDRKAVVQLPGGDLIIEWSEKDNRVYKTGPAVTVFEGEVDIPASLVGLSR